MNITVFAAGSRGDIQPCLVLSSGLQEAGYRVSLAAPEDFTDFAGQHGIPFRPLRGDVQQLMASDTGRTFMQTGGVNPFKSIRAIRTLIRPIIAEMAEDAYEACRDADAIISLGVFSAFGQSIARSLHLPIMHVEPTPLLPTSAFPAASWPVQRNLGGLHNTISGLAMLRVIWSWYQPFVNEFRARLGLSPMTFSGFTRDLKSTPMLSLYSPSIIPHPPDWPDNVHITGYLYLDAHADWQPPRELLNFLAAGAPPVYIGFGSMSGREPTELARVMIEAVNRSRQRGLLLTGWGGLRPESVPEHIFVLDSAPHSWLFPRMSAVVHHGGAGTTAEGLRAGVPSIIVPFIFDQFFWGARIKAMGLGPTPIPQKNLSVERLAHAITTSVTDPGIQQRARAVGTAIHDEDGLNNAVKVVEQLFGSPRTGI